MGLLSNRIDREKLKPGDHIYTWRILKIYAHHGIYKGNGMVVHFKTTPRVLEVLRSKHILPPPRVCKRCKKDGKGTKGIVMTCLDCFLDGDKLYRFAYSVSEFEFAVQWKMTCSRVRCDPPERVLERALSCIEKGFGEYNLITNNCQDFAYYCKTGNRCPQERSDLIRLSAEIVAGTGSILIAYADTIRGAADAYDKYRMAHKESEPESDVN